MWLSAGIKAIQICKYPTAELRKAWGKHREPESGQSSQLPNPVKPINPWGLKKANKYKLNYNHVIVMAKETIQIRIDEDTSRFVERLLRSGLFKTKSDAIRHLLSKGISASVEFSEITEKVKELKSLEKSAGRTPIELTGSLEELLSKRDRF